MKETNTERERSRKEAAQGWKWGRLRDRQSLCLKWRGGECVPGVFDRLVTGYGALWVVGKKCYCEPGALRNYIWVVVSRSDLPRGHVTGSCGWNLVLDSPTGTWFRTVLVALAYMVIEWLKGDSLRRACSFWWSGSPALGVAFGKVCDPLLKAVLAVSLAQHVIWSLHLSPVANSES